MSPLHSCICLYWLYSKEKNFFFANIKVPYPLIARSSFSLLLIFLVSAHLPFRWGGGWRCGTPGSSHRGSSDTLVPSPSLAWIREMMRMLRKINTIYTGEDKLFESFDTCLGWGRSRVLLGVWRERLLMKWWLSMSELWDQRHQWKLEICKLLRKYT